MGHPDLVSSYKIDKFTQVKSFYLFFFLILHVLYFPHCALDLLIFIDGLIRWSNIKSSRPIITWSPLEPYVLKWNVDASGRKNITWGPYGAEQEKKS
jgi:hypothetical protein